MSAVLSLKPSYYEAIKRLTVELAGVKLGADHAFLIETRLSALARKEGFDTLSDMIEELFSLGQSRLAIQIVSSLLERDTHFYTDPIGYDIVMETLLPRLYEIYKGGEVRILSFGCSSGQEPYGLAMKIDKVRSDFADMAIKVIGIDYPSSALERAKLGRYSHFDVQRGLPIRDLVTYFNRQGEDWVLNDKIRKSVEFKEFHLLSNLEGLGQFHVVMFRNTLPHYSSPAQLRVLRGLSKIVKPLGYLVLGSKENLNGMNYGFDTLSDLSGVFRRHELKPEPVIEDPTIKKPTGRKTFEKSKRRVRELSKSNEGKA